MGPSEAPILYLLGTGATVSDPHRTTTMLALEGRDSVVVIDCGGDVVQRLVACDVEPSKVDALIVTHEHPDHVSGFPLMMERLWLYGRRRPLDVYGIAPAIEQARRVHDAFDTSSWPRVPRDLLPPDGSRGKRSGAGERRVGHHRLPQQALGAVGGAPFRRQARR